MWMPMEASALSKWRWVDWLRFFFYRCVQLSFRPDRCNLSYAMPLLGLSSTLRKNVCELQLHMLQCRTEYAVVA